MVLGTCIIALASFSDAAFRLWTNIKKALPFGDFMVAGEVIPEYGVRLPDKLKVTIIWARDHPVVEGSDASFQSSRISTLDASSGTIAYRIALADAPPDVVLMDLAGAKLGVGYVVVFGDRNDNGVYDADEELLGTASKYVTYLGGDLREIAADIGEGSLRTLRSLPRGYSLTEAAQHGINVSPAGLYDLVPIPDGLVHVTLPRDRQRIKVPDHIWKEAG